jgi:hypothetical protein
MGGPVKKIRDTHEADGPITTVFTLKGKLFARTATSTYRVRIRKRWRDKNKPPLAILVATE